MVVERGLNKVTSLAGQLRQEPDTGNIPLTKPEDIWNIKYASRIFDLAKTNGALRRLEYAEYERTKETPYVLLAPSYNWEEMSNLVKVINDTSTTALSVGLANFFSHEIVDSMIFVVPKNIPSDFIPMVVLHEVTEAVSRGCLDFDEVCRIRAIGYECGKSKEEINKDIESAQKVAARYPHIRGCEVELEAVFAQGEDFSRRYAEWSIKLNGNPEDPDTWFNRASSNFLKRNNRENKSPLEIIVELYLTTKYDSDHIRERISINWPWISSYLPEGKVRDPT